jgi:hypothetical protein
MATTYEWRRERAISWSALAHIAQFPSPSNSLCPKSIDR